MTQRLRHFLVALQSGWRAGLRQYRKRSTELAQIRARLAQINPSDEYQRDQIASGRSDDDFAANTKEYSK